MGSVDVPSQGNEVIKIPTSNYEFGANFINQKVCSFAFKDMLLSMSSLASCSLQGFISNFLFSWDSLVDDAHGKSLT